MHMISMLIKRKKNHVIGKYQIKKCNKKVALIVTI